MTLKKHAEQTEQDAKGYILYDSAYVEVYFFFSFFWFIFIFCLIFFSFFLLFFLLCGSLETQI